MLNKKAIFLFLTVLVIVGTSWYLWKKFQKPADESALAQKRIEADAALLGEDYTQLGKFVTKSSRPAKDAYLSGVNTALRKTDISDWTREQLLLRKATALSIMVGEPSETEVHEAMELFHDFVYFPGKSASSTYLKDFSIAAGTKLQFQIRQFPHVTLLNKNSEAFSKYIADGYSESLATNLALNDLAKEVSYENSFDTIVITNQITLASAILASSEEKFLTSPLRKKIIEELRDHLTSFEQGKLKPLFFKDTISAQIEPRYHYAVGYDVYQRNTHDPLSEEINQKINQAYETAIDTARTSPEFKNNTILDQVLFYVHVSYLASLHQRYGDVVEESKLDTLVQGLLGTIRSSSEMSSLASAFLRAKDIYPEINHLYALATKNRSLAEYIASLK